MDNVEEWCYVKHQRIFEVIKTTFQKKIIILRALLLPLVISLQCYIAHVHENEHHTNLLVYHMLVLQLHHGRHTVAHKP